MRAMDILTTEQAHLHNAAAALEDAREALIEAMGEVDGLTFAATHTAAAGLHAAIGLAVAQVDDARQGLTSLASGQMAVRADLEMEMS